MGPTETKMTSHPSCCEQTRQAPSHQDPKKQRRVREELCLLLRLWCGGGADFLARGN